MNRLNLLNFQVPQTDKAAWDIITLVSTKAVNIGTFK
jgi:hypothetical protein